MSDARPRAVALIGWGAIARAVTEALTAEEGIRIAQVIVRPDRRADVAAELPPGIEAISAPEALSPETGLVLEAASHAAVREIVPHCLASGIDVGLLSVGALADADLAKALREAALGGRARLVVVPGAIGGIDALSAAGKALTEVRYTGTKPPRAWAGSPAEETHDLAAVTQSVTLFRGSAREACLRFPKNANVVATVALAGPGFDRTEVELVADPEAAGNSHRIVARGGGFDLDFATRGPALAANPRTSALTACSALRMLRGLAPGLQV